MFAIIVICRGVRLNNGIAQCMERVSVCIIHTCPQYCHMTVVVTSAVQHLYCKVTNFVPFVHETNISPNKMCS